MRLKRVITVNGFLSEESGTTAKSKRDDLDTLIVFGKVLTVVWGAGDDKQFYTGSFLKASIKEGLGRVIDGSAVAIDSSSPEKHFSVQLQFLVGDNL